MRPRGGERTDGNRRESRKDCLPILPEVTECSAWSNRTKGEMRPVRNPHHTSCDGRVHDTTGPPATFPYGQCRIAITQITPGDALPGNRGWRPGRAPACQFHMD